MCVCVDVRFHYFPFTRFNLFLYFVHLSQFRCVHVYVWVWVEQLLGFVFSLSTNYYYYLLEAASPMCQSTEFFIFFFYLFLFDSREWRAPSAIHLLFAINALAHVFYLHTTARHNEALDISHYTIHSRDSRLCRVASSSTAPHRTALRFHSRNLYSMFVFVSTIHGLYTASTRTAHHTYIPRWWWAACINHTTK